MGGGTGGELHRRDLWKLFSNLNSRGSPAESQAEGGSSPGVLYSRWRTLLAAQDTPSPPVAAARGESAPLCPPPSPRLTVSRSRAGSYPRGWKKALIKPRLRS